MLIFILFILILSVTIRPLNFADYTPPIETSCEDFALKYIDDKLWCHSPGGSIEPYSILSGLYGYNTEGDTTIDETSFETDAKLLNDDMYPVGKYDGDIYYLPYFHGLNTTYWFTLGEKIKNQKWMLRIYPKYFRAKTMVLSINESTDVSGPI
jgi:hypothetical protein